MRENVDVEGGALVVINLREGQKTWGSDIAR